MADGTLGEVPDINAVMRAQIEDRVSQMNFCLPGRVESYDSAGQKAVILPLLKRKFVGADPIDLPPVTNVPVMFYRAGLASITFPLKPGNTGTLFFSQRSLEKWLDLGGLVSPDDSRKFDLSDGMFYPGLHPFTDPHISDPDKMVIRNDKLEIELTDSGKIAITNLSSGAELLDLFEQTLTALIAEPMIFNKATFSAIKTLLSGMKG